MGLRKRIVDLFHPQAQPPEEQPAVHCYVTDDENDRYNWLAGQLERMDRDQERDQRRLEDARKRMRGEK